GWGCTSDSSRRAMDSNPSRSHPRAISMRRYEPYALMRTGSDEPSTFVKRSAGPPRWKNRGSERCAAFEGGFGAAALLTLSAISAISSTGDTGASTRTSSPARSSAATKACTLGNMEGKGMPSEQQTNGLPPPAPKRAEHYAEKRDWPGYFEVVLGKPARET